MKGSFEGGLLEYGSLMKRGYAYLIGNSGKIVAAITAAVAALVTFTNVTFAEPFSVSFTSTVCVMLLSSYLIYFSLESAGERLGEESEGYTAALRRYSEARQKITPSMLVNLRSYCSLYSCEELNYRRRAYLFKEGFTTEEYEVFQSGAEVTAAAARVFKRAGKMKPVILTPTTLLSREHTSRSKELESPEKTKYIMLILKLLPSTLCMIFTASLILTAKPDLTVEVVIEGLIKLAALPIVGFRGYESGYFYATGSKVLWLETKANLLEDFLAKENSGLSSAVESV